MKTKIIIFVVLLAAIMLFSMQLWTFIFGNKPVVTITNPTRGATISGTKLTVYGTISDLDGDQSKVKVWIEDTSIAGWDYGVTSGIFEVTLTLSGLTDKAYNIIAEGYDANNNVSDKYIISVNYSNGGGAENILSNGKFANVIDNYNGIYDSLDAINWYLNNTNGDYLDNWQFYIYDQYALDNQIRIDLDGSSVRYFSTYSDGDGNAKIKIYQNLSNYQITSKTRIYIKFKINNFNGGTNPEEAPIKIQIGQSSTWLKTLASYSTGPGSGYDNGNSCVSSLTVGQTYEYDFNIVSESLNLSGEQTIGAGILINLFQIFVNCWNFDVTIYEIRLYEGQ